MSRPPRSSHSRPGYRFALAASATAFVAALAAPSAEAWYPIGHTRIARAAVDALPGSVPAFFRSGGQAIGEASVDPDLLKLRATPRLRAMEEPQHFLDWELLGDAAFPDNRWEMVAMLGGMKLSPSEVGLLPYAVIESFDRLTITLAEHRRWPDNVAIQQKALVYAGILAHYAGDLEQPLHTTLHHNGRALPDRRSPNTGIHFVVDPLIEEAPFDAVAAVRDLPVRELADPWAEVRSELASSHALVDRVYELEPLLRQAGDFVKAAKAAARPAASETAERASNAAPATATTAAGAGTPPAAVLSPPAEYPPAIIAFTSERYRAATAFLASLFYTAWQRSASIVLPEWLNRAPANGVEVILSPRP